MGKDRYLSALADEVYSTPWVVVSSWARAARERLRIYKGPGMFNGTPNCEVGGLIKTRGNGMLYNVLAGVLGPM